MSFKGSKERPPQPLLLRLQARNLGKSFGGNTVLKDISLDLKEGQIVLLRGENASGKTTLLNILTGNLVPDAGTIEIKGPQGHERFEFPRTQWRAINPLDHFTPERVAWEGVGRTWQDVRLFSSQSLLDNIAVATLNQKGENPFFSLLKFHHTRQLELENLRQSQCLINSVGLGGLAQCNAAMISLGQAKRAAIARGVRAGATILFLDEPLAGLDQLGVESVLELLTTLVRKQKLTLVIVEHLFHIPRLLEFADTVWTLQDGHLRKESPGTVKQDIFKTRVDPLSAWVTHPSCVKVEEHGLPGGAKLMLLRSTQQARELLRIEDLEVRRNGRTILGNNPRGMRRGLSFRLCEGDLGILQAPNGWGKTTLLEAVAGVLKIDEGRILLKNRLLNEEAPWERAQRGLIYLQSQGHVFPRMTVAETFELARAGAVPDFLSAYTKDRVDRLSGGQQQTVGLARTLFAKQSICRLLDEPFNMLDKAAIGRFQELIWPQKDSCSLIALPALANSEGAAK